MDKRKLRIVLITMVIVTIATFSVGAATTRLDPSVYPNTGYTEQYTINSVKMICTNTAGGSSCYTTVNGPHSLGYTAYVYVEDKYGRTDSESATSVAAVSAVTVKANPPGFSIPFIVDHEGGNEQNFNVTIAKRIYIIQ